MPARIQAARRARGWSQQELADRAGVTRQLVSSLEAGRHNPGVSAAIAIARALGSSVEDLFGPEHHEFVLSDLSGLAQPRDAAVPVVIGQIGDQRVAYPVDQGLTEEWSLAAGTVQGGRLDVIDQERADLVVAGCDPLLPAMARLLATTTGHRLVAVHASTARAVAALTAGHIHGALVHGPSDAFPIRPPGTRRWHLARWRVGLAASARSGPPTPELLAERRTPVVQRERGASSQQAFERALRAVGSDGSVPGPIGVGHLDVARRVLHGTAPVGVTMEPAASNLGLAFTPLEEHRVELWIDERWCGLPAAVALLELASGESLQRRAGLLPGYDLAGSGDSRAEGPDRSVQR